ncbi:hypothetical protein VTJ49DRAFT_1868 [Mycothermus thermophilus]|uniref:Uncharacterized protein n=1 Tax=Humicola insolens TaxID=85995 RepID=A0ABR3VB82_HUMIN
MRCLSLAVLSLLGLAAATVAPIDKRPCGFKIAPCPRGTYCEKIDPDCDRGENCAGYCVPLPRTLATSTRPSTPRPTYQSCGGFRIKPYECPDGEICVDDPYVGGCGMACDRPGICVKPVFCGGFAGIPCKDGKKCVDDPRDDCDPMNGGADCGGICV